MKRKVYCRNNTQNDQPIPNKNTMNTVDEYTINSGHFDSKIAQKYQSDPRFGSICFSKIVQKSKKISKNIIQFYDFCPYEHIVHYKIMGNRQTEK